MKTTIGEDEIRPQVSPTPQTAVSPTPQAIAINTTINGQEIDLAVTSETAVDVIRDQLGLTGTKLACGGGACGACTILVDGTPTLSCLMPACQMDGRAIQTIEQHHRDNLHPVQLAFMAADGLQCGFCTPGFVNEGIAFYEQWRQQHGRSQPSKHDIALALGGHLCRCGAYHGIYEAIQRACAGEFDETTAIESPRYEAIDKVTGAAKYTVDRLYEGVLAGRILRSPHPHAQVVSIDASEALALDGVFGFVELLEPDRIVRYTGQEIGAVAARDKQTADLALRKIKVTYDVRPHVLDTETARRPDSPLVWSGRKKSPPNAGEGMPMPGNWQHNMRKPLLTITAKQPRKAKRRLDQARQQPGSPLVEHTYQLAPQVHTPLEPHACVARWDSPHHLTVHVSTQGVYETAGEIAEHFDLEEQNVNLVTEHIGGAFGSKGSMTLEVIAAVSLAHQTEQPVRVIFDRLEEMSYTGYRPGAEIDLALLAQDSGEMAALSSHAYSDSGIAVGGLISTMMGLVYPKAPRELVDWDILTHTPPGRPFRGPNGPLACWSLEQAIDEMAYKLDSSPIALRRQWDNNPLRQRLYDWVETLPVWANRGPVGGDGGRFRRGVGVAAANWFYFYHAHSEVKVSSSPEGIVVEAATQDMGNGTHSVLSTAVQEVFDMAQEHIHIKIGRSNAPRGTLSGGSRTANTVFSPTRRAAKQLKSSLVEAAQRELGLADVAATPQGIRYANGQMSWLDLMAQTKPQAITVKRGRDKNPFTMPLALGTDLSTGRGIPGAVTVTEVEVDTRLGQIRPLHVWMGLAVGRIFVPVLARSQVYGSIIQGLGYVLYEKRQLDLKTGHNLTSDLESYHIPGIGDIPEMDIYFDEKGFEHARGEGVGLGELATIGVGASVANAVYHATGWRPLQSPIQPIDVVQALREKGGQ